MALKIFTEAKPFLEANIKPFDITEIGMLQGSDTLTLEKHPRNDKG